MVGLKKKVIGKKENEKKKFVLFDYFDYQYRILRDCELFIQRLCMDSRKQSFIVGILREFIYLYTYIESY